MNNSIHNTCYITLNPCPIIVYTILKAYLLYYVFCSLYPHVGVNIIGIYSICNIQGVLVIMMSIGGIKDFKTRYTRYICYMTQVSVL